MRSAPPRPPSAGPYATRLLAVTAFALATALGASSSLAQQAPDGSGPGALDLSRHAGKVVFVDFWASWCAPCRAAFPWMNALQQELGEAGLVVIGVNTADNPDAAARFLEEVPAEFEIVMDPDGAIARAYGVGENMPVAFIHGRDGTLVATHVGFNEKAAEHHAEELRAFVGSGR